MKHKAREQLIRVGDVTAWTGLVAATSPVLASVPDRSDCEVREEASDLTSVEDCR